MRQFSQQRFGIQIRVRLDRRARCVNSVVTCSDERQETSNACIKTRNNAIVTQLGLVTTRTTEAGHVYIHILVYFILSRGWCFSSRSASQSSFCILLFAFAGWSRRQ